MPEMEEAVAPPAGTAPDGHRSRLGMPNLDVKETSVASAPATVWPSSFLRPILFDGIGAQP